MPSTFVCALLIACGICAASCASGEVEALSSPTASEIDTAGAISMIDKIRSVTFSSRRVPEAGTLDSLKQVGVSHITLIPFGYQEDIAEPSIRFDPNRRWYTESDSGIASVAEDARRLGMGTILKPHIWVGGHHSTGQPRHMVGFDSERRWQMWESAYRRFILHYAHLAARIQADVFVIGTELARCARERPAFWRTLAEEIRLVYAGELTYAANWYEEYEEIEFWPSLDYVGVQTYFPISSSDRPTPSELRQGWRSHAKALARTSAATGRRIFLTEIGYRSVGDAAREPWRWVAREEVGVSQPDHRLQAELYDAFFREAWPRHWLAGASLWRWHNEGESEGPRRDIDFTPQNKPALEIIRRWFTAGDEERRDPQAAPPESSTN